MCLTLGWIFDKVFARSMVCSIRKSIKISNFASSFLLNSLFSHLFVQGGETTEEEKKYSEILQSHILNHGLEEAFLHSGM